MIRIKHIFYTAFLFILFSSCANTEKETQKIGSQNKDDRISVSKVQFDQNEMALGMLEEKAFPISVSVNGMIDVPPENKAVVNSTMGGYIKTTLLLEGDTVTKGQPLVTLENPEYVTLQQKYMEVKEQLNYLKAEYDRQKTMWEENITSQKSFLKAESTYKGAMAQYNGLRKQLTMLNISPANVEKGNITSIITLYAPISGSITKVNVSKGTYVSPAKSVMEIIDNAHIHLELSAFEKDIMKIKKGQKILFTIPEASKETYDAEVYLVGTSLDDNRTIKVHGHPIDESNRFLTGMYVNAHIITTEKTTNVVTESTLVEVDGEYYVLVLDESNEFDYYFKQVKVNIGNTVNGYTEIIDANSLTITDQLLVKGGFGLLGEE